MSNNFYQCTKIKILLNEESINEFIDDNVKESGEILTGFIFLRKYSLENKINFIKKKIKNMNTVLIVQ